ncbi:ARM repeat-containing protein [Russula earlei]|uniref:ARM repeat-containing protein n=1 Tax=Russula earlei TaxID=71964 RepID=A0ACC0UM81_9AGAM|nr:ARM repeat-containing protein [Russula earlei]
MADIQALLAALDVFTRAPDKASLEKANAWLQDFQHSSEAWKTCNLILQSPDTPPAAKLFAAQTFRAKVTYDLAQVDQAQLFPLRDTIIAALEHFKDGPRVIILQLCLALSGLALQLPTWTNAVEGLIDTYGQIPSMVPVLLQFLTVLPEELYSNTKIPVTDQEYGERSAQLLGSCSKQVLEVLSIYLQAPGVTHAIQNQVFACLRSWLIAGEMAATDVADSPIFDFCFQALASDQLFESATNAICDLIHETQEIDDNMAVIERIVPKVIALKAALATAKEDSETMRGYARIFSEAGETYRLLILQHTETFFPIVEAIGQCSAFTDLDVVPITFPFWMRLAQSIGKRASIPLLLRDAYKSLVTVMIKHLHFPPDTSTLTGQELDDFRSFRHVMGDTLKDCCYVLGTEQCLLETMQLVQAALAQSPDTPWQNVEAPLFAMRSIGAEVNPKDEHAVPIIMQLIPTLPTHTRIRYAALLIISRYTEWINAHPDYISPSLQYISAGFEDTDQDVIGAAGQALKYLCQDCKQHLVPFVSELHAFTANIGTKLVQEDKVVVYEAIAHVISAMPMDQAALSLKTFASSILAAMFTIANKPNAATKQELQEVGNGLANLEVMLHVFGSFGEHLPPACQGTCQEVWPVFDAFLARHGSDYESAEHVTRVLRHALNLFGDVVLTIAGDVLGRMSASFATSGLSCYLWIASKVHGRFGNEEDLLLRDAVRDVYERSTQKLLAMLREKSAAMLPDVLEDYIRMLMNMVEFAPDIFFESSAFPAAFHIALAALTLIHTDTVFASLDLIRMILTHDCLTPNPLKHPPPKFPLYANTINQAVGKDGFEFTSLLLTGLVGDFPEETASIIVTLFRVLASLWPSQLQQWISVVLQGLPGTSVPADAKVRFVKDLNDAICAKQYDKVKYAVLGIHRASRKAKDRRKVVPLE